MQALSDTQIGQLLLEKGMRSGKLAWMQQSDWLSFRHGVNFPVELVSHVTCNKVLESLLYDSRFREDVYSLTNDRDAASGRGSVDFDRLQHMLDKFRTTVVAEASGSAGCAAGRRHAGTAHCGVALEHAPRRTLLCSMRDDRVVHIARLLWDRGAVSDELTWVTKAADTVTIRHTDRDTPAEEISRGVCNLVLARLVSDGPFTTRVRERMRSYDETRGNAATRVSRRDMKRQSVLERFRGRVNKRRARPDPGRLSRV